MGNQLSKEFLSEMIELYRSYPCLWKIKSTEYSNRNKKNEAYVELVNKVREKIPTADRDMIVKKINAMRSAVRKEQKKVEHSKKSGSGEDEIYKPCLWYFHSFDFLMDQDVPRATCSSLNETTFVEESNETVSKVNTLFGHNIIVLSQSHIYPTYMLPLGLLPGYSPFIIEIGHESIPYLLSSHSGISCWALLQRTQ